MIGSKEEVYSTGYAVGKQVYVDTSKGSFKIMVRVNVIYIYHPKLSGCCMLSRSSLFSEIAIGLHTIFHLAKLSCGHMLNELLLWRGCGDKQRIKRLSNIQRPVMGGQCKIAPIIPHGSIDHTSQRTWSPAMMMMQAAVGTRAVMT